MAKVLFVIPAKDFRDEEYFIPKEILEKAGHQIVTASTAIGQVLGADGGEAEVEVQANEVDPGNFAAIIFIGGPGMMSLTEEPSFVSLAKKFAKAGKIVAAICVAPLILANAGVLEGKKATVWAGGQAKLEKAGAQYTGEAVIVDGKIITANGPIASMSFGKTIAEALKET